MKISNSMEATHEQMLSILELILPKEILQYFTVTNLTTQAKEVHLYLDERNEVPDELKGEKLVSKGFLPESVVQDFPLRNKALLLHVRRRKWEVESSKKIVKTNPRPGVLTGLRTASIKVTAGKDQRPVRFLSLT